jgi:hypothetical protein
MQVKTNLKAGQIIGNITVTISNTATVTINQENHVTINGRAVE